jgi:PBP1b-binding outer membrane lipoprotein LpoB
MNKSCALSAVAVLALVAGCATPSPEVYRPAGVPPAEIAVNDPGWVAGTGIESQDLVAVTDRMVRGILSVPEIAQAPAAPTVVLEPVVNETRFPINKNLFLQRIRTHLNEFSTGRIRFLDREIFETLERERELQRSGRVVATADPNATQFRGADYFLTGKLQSLSTRTSGGLSDYVLYSFRLTSARTSEIIWENSVEIKKQGLEDAVYR